MAGRYNKYADYKNSNNAWLGDIPSHWRIMSLRHFVSSLKNGSTETQVDYGLDTVPVSRIETISKGTIDIAKVGYVDKDSISESFRLESGDLLLSHINSLAMVGNVAQVDSSHFLYHGMNLLRLIPSKTVSSDYLFWQLKSSYCRSLIESVAKPAINQASVSTESLKSLQLLHPAMDEQIAISNFLAHETAKIDTLITKQEKLIELLKEKRQAVISHAVTKGLNPNAPMKDSGVEWLGEVPEHWVVAGFKKYLSSIIDYRGKTPEKVDSGKFLVTARNIKRGKIDYSLSQEFVSELDYKEVMSRGLPQIGDVLFTTEAPMGEVAQVDKTDIALAQRIIKFCGQLGLLDNSFLKYFIMSAPFQDSLKMHSSGSTAAGIKSERLVYLRQLIPPIDEQIYIVSQIESKSKKFEELEIKANHAISLMQERKTALISAAVTGKIDLRDWQGSAEAKY